MSEIKLDIPDITVIIDKGDEYKVIVNNPGTVVKNVTGSLLRYADIAGLAYTASYAETALTASYVAGAASDWSTLANKPEGLVSSSVQVQLDEISGTTFDEQDFTFPQNLTVGGTLIADTLLVSSSTIFSSGSTKFGDSPDDTHQFTGSIIAENGFTGSFKGDGSQLTGLVTDLRISGSSGSDTLSLLTDDLTIVGSNGITTTITDNTVTIAAPPGTVTSSQQIDVFQTTGGDNVATLGANTFYGNQTIFGTLEIDTGNIVVTSGNSLIVSGAIFAQNEFVGGFVSASVIEAPNITGSLFGTASVAEGIDIVFAGEYETGSDAPIALQVGGTGNVISASYAVTASYALSDSSVPSGTLSSSAQLTTLGFVSSSTINTIQTITSASYAAITPVSGTLYIIID